MQICVLDFLIRVSEVWREDELLAQVGCRAFGTDWVFLVIDFAVAVLAFRASFVIAERIDGFAWSLGLVGKVLLNLFDRVLVASEL